MRLRVTGMNDILEAHGLPNLKQLRRTAKGTRRKAIGPSRRPGLFLSPGVRARRRPRFIPRLRYGQATIQPRPGCRRIGITFVVPWARDSNATRSPVPESQPAGLSSLRGHAWKIGSSNNPSSILPTSTRRSTGSSMTRASRPSASSKAGAVRSSSHPSRSPRSRRRQRRSSSSSSTKVGGCQPRSSSTTLRRWSMRSAVRWINGEAFAIPTTGASHPKPLGCFSIGGTMTSATSAPSSARSKQSRRRSG